MTERITYPPRWIREIDRYKRLIATFRNWPTFLALKGRSLHRIIRLETRGGLKVLVPPSAKFEFKDIFLHYAYGFGKVLHQLPRQPVVLDIGAHVGFFSLFALHQRPESFCLSFEPLSENFCWLERQREMNPSARWEICQLAVKGHGGNVLVCGKKKAGEIDAEAVVYDAVQKLDTELFANQRPASATSLPTIFLKHGLDECHWLKMDCEGCEYEILYECPEEVLKRIKIISLEVHAMDQGVKNATALCAHLAASGFRCFQADDAVLHAIRKAALREL
jgi:FkbM family methyltransferase